MRRWTRSVPFAILLLLPFGTAVAGPIEEAADKVLAAIKEGNGAALKALADDTVADPWLVAEELCVRGEYAAATRLATVSPRRDLERLPAYIESRRGKPRDEAAVAALAKSKALLRDKKQLEGLAALEGVEPDGKTTATVSIFVFRAMALRDLRRFAESGRAWDEVGSAADRIGWSIRA